MNDMVRVYAEYIDSNVVKYLCPFCKKIHTHGSSGDTSNGILGRFSHCKVNKDAVEIIVNDFTKRNEK